MKKMKETVQSWMPYLSDNYQAGDSVYFLRTDLATQETQVEGFLVEASFFQEWGYEDEDDPWGYKDEEHASFSYVITGYSDEAILRNKDSYIYVDLAVSYDGEADMINEYCNVMINSDLCFTMHHHTIDKDYFTVTSCLDTCTMQRNVGIINFSNDQYSWELINKN